MNEVMPFVWAALYLEAALLATVAFIVANALLIACVVWVVSAGVERMRR